MSAPPATPFADLETRLDLEALIADCALQFTAEELPSDFEQVVARTLTALVRLLRADRAALVGGSLADARSWSTFSVSLDGGTSMSGAPVTTGAGFASSFPWQFERLWRDHQATAISRLSDLPAEAGVDRGSAAAAGIRSMLSVPIADGCNVHCLTVQTLHDERIWSAHEIDRLPSLARVLVNVLNRRLAAEARRAVGDADLLASVRAIVWRADARTFQTTFVSKEAETILGYPVEYWLTVPGFWLDHVHPDDRAWVAAFSAKATEQHLKHDFEYRMIVADGRTVWLRNIVNVLVEHGRATGLVGVTTDITERKLAEFETARLRHQVTHAGRVSSLGELAATLAHELNTPLGAIVSNAEAAQVFMTRVPPPLDRVAAIVADILEDGKRAGDIVHRVRMLMQKQTIERRPLDLVQLLNGVAALTRPLALSRQIDLTVAADPDLPVACGDPVQVQQVLLNLIFNAIDAIGDSRRRQVTVRAARAGGANVDVRVSDTGSGFARDIQAHAFDPFFTTKIGSLGMGLAICRSIVESHGGEILVENNATGGATVRFTLPVCTDGGEA